MRLSCWVLFGMFLINSGCHRNWHYVPLGFEELAIPNAPSYSDDSSWAARPELRDEADTVPAVQFEDKQKLADVDVFFIHPTTFFDKDEKWNASLENEELNLFTDEAPIRHQATIFNGSCRVYAPRYRQAHIKSYLHEEEGGIKALELAYTDIKRAFSHYLEHDNGGRPFFICGHSQGATHGIQLIKEFVDGTKLQDQLIAAYLVGMPVKVNEFDNIPPCLEEGDIGCFMSWMTFGKGYTPWFYEDSYLENMIVNPVTFSALDSTYNDYEFHKGIVVKSFQLKYINSISAKPEKGLLYIKRPNVPVLKWFVKNKTWHSADLNLFWVNMRENVAKRLANYNSKINPSKP